MNVPYLTHFRELSRRDPEEVCRRALCRYDSVIKRYTLRVWGRDYGIFPQEAKISCLLDETSAVNIYLGLFIVYYLLRSKKIRLRNEWISEKDIPGGVTFFRGPHEIPAHVIGQRCGNNLEIFKEKCERQGGVFLNMADAAYGFRITPRIRAAVLYWQGDDEFEAAAGILFDKSIMELLTLDVIFSLAVEICTRLGEP
ncbi:MAG: DUF3786 domain-containing protein [Desulfobacterales bacterium]|nr:DUF3786 domain-containing protein [Desulfobacterales bacterium]